MIFVTVGTHEQQFNRLLSAIDNISGKKVLNDKFIIQAGYSTYIPKNCESRQFFSFQEMNKLMDQARIIVTHGGPSSFMMALERKKIPIVVPRQLKYEEHVNNHQLDFVDAVAKEKKNIIPVNEIENLESTLVNYSHIVDNMQSAVTLNNDQFTKHLEELMWNVLKK
ncbi:glycosyltransferase [Lactiplantibacillus plantarum]|uniref:glycosyltransferase n=1 Tax=Lactiplantibacillus plantarum TaxID=1590 RepID=UPI003750C221